MKRLIISMFLLLSVVSLCFGQHRDSRQITTFIKQYEALVSDLSEMVFNLQRAIDGKESYKAREYMQTCKELQKRLNILQSKYSFYADEIANNSSWANRILSATERASVTLARLQNLASMLE